jgi:hypothetical protein
MEEARGNALTPTLSQRAREMTSFLAQMIKYGEFSGNSMVRTADDVSKYDREQVGNVLYDEVDP